MDDNYQADFERRLQAQADRHRADYAKTYEQIFGQPPPADEPQPDLTGLPLDQALAAYEAWANRRTAANWAYFGQQRDQQRPEPDLGPDLVAYWAGQPEKLLGLADRLMDCAFDLDRWLPKLRLAHPIRYCTSPEEYAAPLVKHLGWPQDQCDAALRRVAAGATGVPLVGELAYDLHGVGTFVNGWLLGRQRSMSPVVALDGDLAFLARSLGQVAAIRWGNGFLLTYTRLGQEICRAGLGHTSPCRALGLPVSDQARLMQRAFFLCRAGWSSWLRRFVEAYARRRLAGKLEPKSGWDTTVEMVELTLEHVVPSVPGVSLVKSALEFVYQSAKTLGLALKFWDLCADWVYDWSQKETASPKPVLEQESHNWVGKALVRHLESRLGTYSLPYALLIAGEVDYGLPDVAPSDLLSKLRGMRTSPDGRLVLLTMLESNPAYDPLEVAAQAEHRLQLDVPEALRRPAKE